MSSNRGSYNIITIGDTCVGKTSIIIRYTENRFSESILCSIGICKTFKNLVLKNGETIRISLIDTAGQEKYESLNKAYVRNVDGVLFVFDLSKKKTFFNIKKWIKFFNENAQKKDIPKFLIGNKKDLKREVGKDLIDIFLGEYQNYFIYKETSAKEEDPQINELFQEMGEILYSKFSKYKNNNKIKGVKISGYKEKNKHCNCIVW